jgi:hypothetical protein
MAKFTVIVKHYRRPYLLQLCLESLAVYWPRPKYDYKIIVADDGTDPVIIDCIYGRIGCYVPPRYDLFLTNPRGAGKWALAREMRFPEVAHTCGDTWNTAYSVAESDYIFLIEDDSRLIRESDPYDALQLLESNSNYLCVIGLKQRVDLEASGFGTRVGGDAVATVYTHDYWPWSFDSIFFRRSDWAKIGPWPPGVATSTMESWLTGRLRATGFISRPYVVLHPPISAIDEETRVRVDRDTTKNDALTYIHADACLREWLRGRFDPSIGSTIPIYPDWLRRENFFR